MHTAGEWKYSVQTGLVYVDGKGIAKVYGAGQDSASYSAEGEANARLIAAAPIMYGLLNAYLTPEYLGGMNTLRLEGAIRELMNYLEGVSPNE